MRNDTETGGQALREREEKVLKWVIRDHAESGCPVGSGRLASLESFNLSPASLRNVLHTLETSGFLSQPHTSAGRVPTEQGYRYFVDRLMQAEQPVPELVKNYDAGLDELGRDLDALIRNTTQFLGDISHALVLMTRPRLQAERIRSLALHELDKDTILLIVQMSLDQVRTIAFEMRTRLSRTVLREAEMILNDLFADMSIQEVRDLVAQGEAEVARKNPVIDHVMDRFEAVLHRGSVEDYRIYGTHQLLHYPELTHPADLERLLEAIDSDTLQHYLPSPQGVGQPSVLIGSELGKGPFHQMSLISVAYQGTDLTGEIHILGPTRMRYEQNVGLVAYTADRMEKLMTSRKVR